MSAFRKTNLTELFIMKSDGSERKTHCLNISSNPHWINKGKKIAFLEGNRSSQIWSMNPDGGGMTKL